MIIARCSPFFPKSKSSCQVSNDTFSYRNGCFSDSTFLIMKSCSKSTSEKQGKICWLIACWVGGGGVLAKQVVSGDFWIVAGDIGWFQMVCCFSSYTNFITYRRVISLLYSWTHAIDLVHSIFLFKVRQQEIANYCELFETRSFAGERLNFF